MIEVSALYKNKLVQKVIFEDKEDIMGLCIESAKAEMANHMKSLRKKYDTMTARFVRLGINYLELDNLYYALDDENLSRMEQSFLSNNIQ